MRFLEEKSWAGRAFSIVIVLGDLAVAAALLILAYLGTFSRTLADDYCLADLLGSSGNVFQATLKSYTVWSDRYSNLFLIQLIEWGGERGIQTMSAVSLILWVVGLTWLVSELCKAVGLKVKPGAMVWKAGLIVFLSFFEAPNLYQVLYWRAGLVTYLAPLIFLVFTASFMLWQIRTDFQRLHLVGACLVCFGLIFFAGGSSETTSALQIGVLLIACVMVWLKGKPDSRRRILILLGVSLASAVLSILVMSFAPGNGVRLNTPTSDAIILIRETITYTVQFLWLTLRTLPLPSAVSTTVPFLITFIYRSPVKEKLSAISSRGLRLTAVLIPAMLLIVIAFSFAPSAYAQSFPVDRARFPAIFLLTLSLGMEGAVLGLLASRVNLPLKPGYIDALCLLLLCVLAIYPIRAAYNVYSHAEPEYHQWSSTWDARQEQIFAKKAAGEQDIVIQQLPSIGYVKELDTRPNYWVNHCAAEFYGVRSLAAPQYGP